MVALTSVQTVVIGVAGASGSGKSTLAEALGAALHAPVIKIDDYYRPLCHISYEERCEINFDHPSTIDHELLVAHLRQLAAGTVTETPLYDFTRHTRFAQGRVIEPNRFVVVEGIFTFCYSELVDLCGVKVFVEAPEDVCLDRRMRRDVCERGRTQEEVLARFNGHVWPMYLEHIQPTREFADVRVSGLRPVEEGLSQVTESFPVAC